MNLLKNPIIDRHFIFDLIPQKPPFVMIDKLLYFSNSKVVSGLFLSDENLFVKNNIFHAPGLIENMAQTIALHTGYQFHLKKEPAPIGYIGAIKKVQIISQPQAGQELTTTATILHDIMGVTLVKAEIECGSKIIASGEMKTALAK